MGRDISQYINPQPVPEQTQSHAPPHTTTATLMWAQSIQAGQTIPVQDVIQETERTLQQSLLDPCLTLSLEPMPYPEEPYFNDREDWYLVRITTKPDPHYDLTREGLYCDIEHLKTLTIFAPFPSQPRDEEEQLQCEGWSLQDGGRPTELDEEDYTDLFRRMGYYCPCEEEEEEEA